MVGGVSSNAAGIIGGGICPSKKFTKFSGKKKSVTYYTTDKERLDRVPSDENRGTWVNNTRGEGKFVASNKTGAGRAANRELKKYGLDGIEYSNSEPDFSVCSETTLTIANMIDHRQSYMDDNDERIKGNFEQADLACAEHWNSIGKDGRTDWTKRAVADYRNKNKLTWHERCDKKTMDLVKTSIHSYFNHLGGISEKKHEHEYEEYGGFDD